MTIAPDSRATRVRLASFGRLTVTVALLAVLLRIVPLAELGRTLISADPLWVAAAVLIALADRALMIGKWYPLLTVQSPGIPLGHAARAYIAAGFASILLPTSLGADALRAVALGRGAGAVVEVGASVVMERLLGLLASGVMCLMALGVALRSGIEVSFLLPWALAAVVAALAALVLPRLLPSPDRPGPVTAPTSTRAVKMLATPPAPRPRRAPGWSGRLATLVRRFATAHRLYNDRPGLLFGIGALSLVEQSFPIFVLACLSRALGGPASPTMLCVVVPLTLFVSRLPIAIWSLGVVEVALVYLLGLFGVSAPAALALALAGRAVELVALLPGAFVLGDLTPTLRRQAAERITNPQMIRPRSHRAPR